MAPALVGAGATAASLSCGGTRLRAGGATTYGYDAGNNLTFLAEPGGSCTGTVSRCTTYTYDANDRRTAIAYPGGSRVEYRNIDNFGRPLDYWGRAGNGAVVMDFNYSYTAGGADTGLVRTRTDRINAALPSSGGAKTPTPHPLCIPHAQESASSESVISSAHPPVNSTSRAGFELGDGANADQAHGAHDLGAQDLDRAVDPGTPTGHEAVEVGPADHRERGTQAIAATTSAPFMMPVSGMTQASSPSSLRTAGSSWKGTGARSS